MAELYAHISLYCWLVNRVCETREREEKFELMNERQYAKWNNERNIFKYFTFWVSKLWIKLELEESFDLPRIVLGSETMGKNPVQIHIQAI